MKIEILGTGCPKCRILHENVKKAVEDLQLDCTISKVEDIGEIVEYGVMMTPALVVDGDVKFAGKVLTPEQIKKFLV
ncbi:MAG: TM0996/MTH895 family glutaredoxin-like protein [Acidobacteria bacterium]|nr:TM0996/MTH895 family glutaredoxin-like protein [Acidobacteriota bacterium]